MGRTPGNPGHPCQCGDRIHQAGSIYRCDGCGRAFIKRHPKSKPRPSARRRG